MPKYTPLRNTLPSSCFVQTYACGFTGEESLEEIATIPGSENQFLVDPIHTIEEALSKETIDIAQGIYKALELLPSFTVSKNIDPEHMGMIFMENDIKSDKFFELKDLDSLYQIAKPCAVFKDNELVFDDDARVCRELTNKNIRLLNAYYMERLLLRFISPFNANEIRFSKLLFYAKGSFIEKHCDSRVDNQHVGNIVVDLGSEYEGGELIFTNENEEVVFKRDDYKLAAFTHGVFHQVRPVTSGMRIFAVFQMLSTNVKQIRYFNDKPEKFKSIFRDLVLNSNFKGVVVVLKHNYDNDSIRTQKPFGQDTELVRLLKASSNGASIRMVPIFAEECDDRCEHEDIYNYWLSYHSRIEHSPDRDGDEGMADERVPRPNLINLKTTLVLNLGGRMDHHIGKSVFYDIGTQFTHYRKAAVALNIERSRNRYWYLMMSSVKGTVFNKLRYELFDIYCYIYENFM